MCAFVALIAARLLGLPYSLQARAHDIHRLDYRYGMREKILNAEFIITNTQYNVDQLRAVIPARQAARVKLIHNGLNLCQFRPASLPAGDDSWRDKSGNGGGNGGGVIRLVCVARLIDQKGLTFLLQACRRLVDAGLCIHCDIVGGYEDIFMNYYIELVRLRQALRLEEIVHLAGSMPFEEVLDYYRKADIFVLPCVIAKDGSRDIIPNSVLEAMAMRLPVVSTNVTGLPELVVDGVSGFLVPPHDVNALVDAIATLSQSARLRNEFGCAGRNRVETLFDSDTNVTQYQSLFCPARRHDSK